jgi:anionic cell wall polymer biosynthesis LytR-Cps2A-Psr (LCP) family protein
MRGGPPSRLGISRIALTVALLTALAASIAQPVAVLAGAPGLNEGTDGRLTVLLLASDSRGVGISRTDSIMIASIDENKAISTASIPRDTGRIPLPASIGGGVYKGKINGMVKSFIKQGLGRDAALNRFEVVIENLLQIEIDYRVVLWFGGMTTLVAEIDPITVNIPKVIKDSKLIDDHDPTARQGVYFPAATNYQLWSTNESANGKTYCNGNWRFDPLPIEPQNMCHRALPFTRSRKGPGNNDWVREARQQRFLFSAINATADTELSTLVNVAMGQGNGKWLTNIPINIDSANYLYNRFSGSTFPATNRVVFKPTTYASHIINTSAYQLKLPAVRSWTAAHLR